MHGLHQKWDHLVHLKLFVEIIDDFLEALQKLHFLSTFLVIDVFEVPECLEERVLEPLSLNNSPKRSSLTWHALDEAPDHVL